MATVFSMAKGKPKRAPAWSRPEVLDLIGLWGEETVLSQLRSSKRNLDIYGKISQGMLEKGHQRDAYQCRVKIKELRLSYQKAREANRRSGSSPKTCKFYDEVHAILGGDPTTMPPQSIDTSAASESMSNEDETLEDEILESREHENGVSLLPESQELILIPKQSTSTQDSTNDPMEGTSDIYAVDRPLRNAADRLSLIRRKKRKNREDMFSELMSVATSAETEQRTWRQSMSQTIRSAIDSHRETQAIVRSTSEEVLKVLREQLDVLWHLVDRHDRRQGTVPLQTLQNAPETTVVVPSTSPATTRSHARLLRMQPQLSSTPASSHPTPGDRAGNPPSPFPITWL
ncbi:uncharacterized protein [Emydura macquarii macquarii]|uniref:uncharacterized protein n=1 Tax=Emydura macquarii macquarii TaxID=1129001 RepID=UPI00352A49C7